MSHNADLAQGFANANKTYTTIGKSMYDVDFLPGNYQLFTMKQQAGAGNSVEIDFLGFTSTMRKWTGSKQEKQWRMYSQTLTSIPYEATYALQKEDIQYGNKSVAQKLQNFLSGSQDTYQQQAVAALIANGTGYDGVALFASNHPHGNTTNSNTGTTTLSMDAWNTTDLAMRSWQNEFGRPIPSRADTIIVGPAKVKLAREIFNTQLRSKTVDHTGSEVTEYGISNAAVSNIYEGEVTVVEVADFADGTRDNYWYALNSKTPFKPIALLETDKIHPVVKDQPTDDNMFFNRRALYSLEGDFVFGPGFWHTCYRQAATS